MVQRNDSRADPGNKKPPCEVPTVFRTEASIRDLFRDTGGSKSVTILLAAFIPGASVLIQRAEPTARNIANDGCGEAASPAISLAPAGNPCACFGSTPLRKY